MAIKNKNNSLSKDIINYPGIVRKEIIRQATKIYDTYEHSYIYPDETNNINNGYITKKDIADIVRINTNLPRMRFLYSLVKYCYPRRYRNFINIHSDNLVKWGSRDKYIQFLDELNKLEIVKRGNKYVKDGFSKSINIKWNFKDPGNAILYYGRSPDSFEDTIKLSYDPEEFKELLKKAGSGRTTAIEIIRRIF